MTYKLHGRPPTGKHVGAFTLPDDLMAWFRAYAVRMGTSMSSIVERLLRDEQRREAEGPNARIGPHSLDDVRDDGTPPVG